MKSEISDSRKEVLNPLIQYLTGQLELQAPVVLNFICTHNSRRSQMAQIWAQFAGYLYEVPVRGISGGVEVTSFNQRAAVAIQKQGFKIKVDSGDNPKHTISYSDVQDPIIAYSKVFDDPENEAGDFAAVLTCSDVDDKCPFIPGAAVRIPVHYEDPKSFDDSPLETKMYDERANQIAAEMLYVFSNIKKA